MSADDQKHYVAKTYKDWLANISEFLSEEDHLSLDEVKAELREEGIDPDALIKRGKVFVEELRRQATYRMLGEARENQKRVLDSLEGIEQPSGTINELKEKIKARLEAIAARGTPQVAFAFRNLEALTEEDLKTFLVDIEMAERLSVQENENK